LELDPITNGRKFKLRTQKYKPKNTFQASLEADSNANGREFEVSRKKIQRKKAESF